MPASLNITCFSMHNAVVSLMHVKDSDAEGQRSDESNFSDADDSGQNVHRILYLLAYLCIYE